ncbi:hypothetical protein U1Q18_027970, partial [Sarracenia purpurea var. burkii]
MINWDPKSSLKDSSLSDGDGVDLEEEIEERDEEELGVSPPGSGESKMIEREVEDKVGYTRVYSDNLCGNVISSWNRVGFCDLDSWTPLIQLDQTKAGVLPPNP